MDIGTAKVALDKIQVIAAQDFITNSNSIQTAPTSSINGKNYILINITDSVPTIYMIDSSNYYVSGYMRKIKDDNYVYFCCSGSEVIEHSTSYT